MEEEKSCMTWTWSRVVPVVLNSKAELIILFFAIAYNMPSAFIQNLIIQKLCMHRNYSRDYCLNNTINKTFEESMQGEVSQLLLYYHLLRQLAAIILALFMGQWCDKYGRKYVIIIASTGCTISTMLFFINAWFIDWPPVFLVLSAIPAGLSGDGAGFLLGLYGFIRDIHPMKSLSVRLSTADGAISLAIQVGPLMGDQLYKRFGAEGVFLTCVVLYICGILCTVIFVKDDNFRRGVGWWVAFRDFFDCRGFVSCVVSVFKKRDGHLRAYILCVLVCGLITTMSNSGLGEMFFLYARLTVDWDVSDLNLYNSFVGSASAIGSFIVLPLLVKVFHCSDSTLGLIGLIAYACFYYILAFTKKSLVYYGSTSLIVLATFSYISFYSIISKCISVTEIGKVIGLYVVIQAGATNLGQIVATQIYSNTYRFFPGTYMVFAGSIVLICITLYIWISVDLKKNCNVVHLGN